MFKSMNVFELLVFIIGCTICLILIVAIIGFYVTPTTADNAQIRTKFIDLVIVIAGSIITIVSSKLLGRGKDDNAK
jgi:uncharacterized membrane protein